jgi:hypothetical protein
MCACSGKISTAVMAACAEQSNCCHYDILATQSRLQIARPMALMLCVGKMKSMELKITCHEPNRDLLRQHHSHKSLLQLPPSPRRCGITDLNRDALRGIWQPHQPLPWRLLAPAALAAGTQRVTTATPLRLRDHHHNSSSSTSSTEVKTGRKRYERFFQTQSNANNTYARRRRMIAAFMQSVAAHPFQDLQRSKPYA